MPCSAAPTQPWACQIYVLVLVLARSGGMLHLCRPRLADLFPQKVAAAATYMMCPCPVHPWISWAAAADKFYC